METVKSLFPNVDTWGAKEWFERLVMAVERRDKAILDGDDIAFETYKRIAGATASRLVRDFKDDIRAALESSAKDEPRNG